jgi:hypothetical protein
MLLYKNVNDNVTDRNVDTSSNNVNSDAGTQTEETCSNVDKTYSSNYPVHESKIPRIVIFIR